MSKPNVEYVEVVCEERHRTDKAVLIWAGDMTKDPLGNRIEKRVWVPLSLTRESPDGFEVPVWFAKKEGLI